MDEFYHADQPAVQLPLFVFSKVCKICGIEKPLEQFHKQPGGKLGVASKCAICDNAHRRDLERNPPIPHVSPEGQKFCNKCKIDKPLDAFGKDRTKKDGLSTLCFDCRHQHKKTRYDENPEKFRARSRAAKTKNPEYSREYGKRYRPRKNAKVRERYANEPGYKEKHQSRKKQNQLLNPPKYTPHRAEYNRQWRQNNRHKITQYAVRRYAIKKLATTPDHVDYDAILKEHGYHCYICDGDIRPEDVAFDHVIPLIPRRNTNREPGLHDPQNIRPVHQCCNSRKSNNLLEEMTPYQRRGPDYVTEERKKDA